MAINLGAAAIGTLKLGTAAVAKLMLGAAQVWAAGAASAPTVTSISAPFSSTNAPSLNISSLAPQSGDILVAIIANSKQSGTLTLSGWTQLLDAEVVTSLTRGGVFWKVSDGTETAVAPTSSAGFATWSIQCHRIAGTSGIDASNMGTTTTAANTPAPAVTTTAANCLILSAWFANTDLGAGVLPATALVEDFGGGREWAGSSYTTQASAGASTPLAITAASATRRAITIAFAP